MKFGPVTKLGKKSKSNGEKNDNNLMLEICDFIAIFLIYGKFGAIWSPDSGCIDCQTYTFINNNLLPYKN